MRTTILLLIALHLAGPALADSAPVTPATVRDRLAALQARDQAGRNKLIAKSQRDGLPLNAPQYADLRKRQTAIDRSNQAQLDVIVRQYGWPTIRLVGAEAAAGAFEIVQHAGLDYQKKYLPVIREAVANRQAAGPNLALLEDRVRIREGRKQLYGTQTHEPIEDPANVDSRRARLGLGPLAVQAATR
jgi:hypothetical protein